MDNIVDYLVALFFIVSFLTSIFKKKKNKQNDTNEKRKVTPKNAPNLVTAKNANNPFGDFFKSINEEIVKAKTESSRSEVDDYYENAMQNSAEVNVAHQNNYQRKEFIEPTHEMISPKVNEGISIESYQESLKEIKNKRDNKKTKELRNKLKQNNSIKDFIIITEILGKPKALQR